MINFHDMKLESNTKSGIYSKNLVLMVSKDYAVDIKNAQVMVQQLIKKSTNGMQLFYKLKKKLKK